MVRINGRTRLPNGIDNIAIKRACMYLVATSQLSLEQLDILEGQGTAFYRHGIKAALNPVRKVLEPYVNELFDFSEETDAETEKGFHMVTELLDTFFTLLAECQGEAKFNELREILNSISTGKYTFNDVSQTNKENENN